MKHQSLSQSRKLHKSTGETIEMHLTNRKSTSGTSNMASNRPPR